MLFLSAFTRWLSHTFPAPQLWLLEMFAACSLGEAHPSLFSWASFMVHGAQGSDFTMSGSGSFCNANLFPGAVEECHLALLKQLLVFREERWAAVASLRGALNHHSLDSISIQSQHAATKNEVFQSIPLLQQEQEQPAHNSPKEVLFTNHKTLLSVVFQLKFLTSCSNMQPVRELTGTAWLCFERNRFLFKNKVTIMYSPF